MPLIPAEANQMLTTEVTRLPYLSVHTSDPGLTGAGEATSGGRQQLAWGVAAGGSISASPATFAPAPGQYGWGGYWSAATGGTYLGSFAFTAPKTVAAGDTLKVTATLGETLL